MDITAIVGKWHLGLGTKERPVDFNGYIGTGPLSIGFSYAYYFPATNDRVPCVFIENTHVDRLRKGDSLLVSYRHKIGDMPTGRCRPDLLKIKPHLGHDATIVNGISRIGWQDGGISAFWKDEKMSEALLDKAKKYICQHVHSPFFLYYATNNAHEPRVPSKCFRGKSKAGIYGKVIEEFDYCVGEIVKTLKEQGILDNTLIIVTSDNGPMVKEGYEDGALEHINHHDPYGGLHGEKYSLYEGGTQMPFIVSWPKCIQRHFIQRQNYCYIDMLATLARLLDLPITEEECQDSRDGSALFLKENAPLYRDYVLTQNNGGKIAVRSGFWKFIPHQGRMGPELYDLSTDPSELHNMVISYPNVAARLQKQLMRDVPMLELSK